jgi:hypothetical protein
LREKLAVMFSLQVVEVTGDFAGEREKNIGLKSG